jgi:hypothetical protein
MSYSDYDPPAAQLARELRGVDLAVAAMFGVQKVIDDFEDAILSEQAHMAFDMPSSVISVIRGADGEWATSMEIGILRELYFSPGSRELGELAARVVRAIGNDDVRALYDFLAAVGDA